MDLKHLKAQLLTSGLQQTNNALFQIIVQLIDALTSSLGSSSGNSGIITVDLTAIKGKTYLTEVNETAFLPSSRQILAGTGIIFDYSVFGKLTISINSDLSSAGYWTPLTDGDPLEMDLISASGDAIMVFVPTP